MLSEKSIKMKNKTCSIGFEGEYIEKSCRELLEVSINNFSKTTLFVYFTLEK